MFYFQDATEDNGIHVPLIIRIQTSFQLQAMVSLGDNWAISMDATFNPHTMFATMFVNPTYLHIYDNEYDDEETNEDHPEEPWIIDMCKLMTLDDTSPNVGKKKDHNQPSSSSTLMEKVFVRMGDIMQEIINEVKEGGV